MQAFFVEATWIFLLSVCILAAIRLVIQFRVAVASIQDHPGYRVLLNTASYLAATLHQTKGIAFGFDNQLRNKHSSYEWAGWDSISVVSVFPRVTTELYLADAAAIKEVTLFRHRFPKPLNEYAILLCFGSNIVASENEDWKRVRKIVAPAFSDRNNRLVWDETYLIMLDLFNNVWGDRKEIAVDHCVDITLQVYLCLSATFQVILSKFQDCAIRYQCCRIWS